jgi:predicted HNH restriction endonuclease
MVETNYRSLFALAPVRAAHLPEFQEWVVEEDRKADATAHKYSRFLTRAAEHYEVPIHERTLAHEFDVNRIVSRISEVVARRGRWADGTFNAHDITDNLIPALHAYVCFAKAKYPASREIIMEANDVPQGKIPQGVRQEISRLVRDTKMSQEIKALHEYTCQLCGIRMALRPGEFYAEGHHLKPLGRPHNGEDVPENVVCVCPNCHVLLDYNVVPITLGTLRLVPGHTVGRDYVDYHNAHCR